MGSYLCYIQNLLLHLDCRELHLIGWGFGANIALVSLKNQMFFCVAI